MSPLILVKVLSLVFGAAFLAVGMLVSTDTGPLLAQPGGTHH